jgi:uncharacterized membrane protein (DUF485 family)
LSDPNPVASPNASQPAASRLGLGLFAAYTLLYLGFVFINAFSADTMDTIVFAGLNLAIVYGFGLIIVAIVFAFVYGFASSDSAEIAAEISAETETERRAEDDASTEESSGASA